MGKQSLKAFFPPLQQDQACGASISSVQFSSVQYSLSVVSNSATPWTAACQASLSITNCQVYPNPCPLSLWCHPTISSSVVPFSCLQLSQHQSLFKWVSSSHQVANIGASASTSVLSVNTQDWSPLGWTGWISLQSKGLWRVFSNTTVQKYQFIFTQLSL